MFLGHPPMGLCRSCCSTSIERPLCPTSLCWQQRESRVSDALVPPEPVVSGRRCVCSSVGDGVLPWYLMGVQGQERVASSICAGSDVSQCSLCEASSCPCGGRGLHGAEEGAMATGINGITNVGCKGERGEGWMCSQVKLLAVACTDSTGHSLGAETLMLFKAETSVYL